MNRWRHSNDVIIKKSFLMFKIKFPTKRIFRIFPVLRINGMAPFCNLFMERPSYLEWVRAIAVALPCTVEWYPVAMCAVLTQLAVVLWRHSVALIFHIQLYFDASGCRAYKRLTHLSAVAGRRVDLVYSCQSKLHLLPFVVSTNHLAIFSSFTSRKVV